MSIRHSPSPIAAAEGLFERAGLRASEIAPLTGGVESLVWRVTADGNRYTARRFAADEGQEALLRAELLWLDALATRGLAVPQPARLGATTPAPLIEHGAGGETIAYWTVLEWVEGESLDRLPTDDEARHIGRTIAAMHDAARCWVPPASFARPDYRAATFRSAHAELVARVGGALEEAEKSVVESATQTACAVLDKLWAERHDLGIIHADVHDGNLLWHAGRPGPALIDFARCGTAPMILDVAMAQHYLTPDLGEALLAGYLEEAAAPAEAIEALPALRYLAAVENFAILSGIPTEIDAIIADLPWLADQASTLLR